MRAAFKAAIETARGVFRLSTLDDGADKSTVDAVITAGEVTAEEGPGVI